MDDSNPNEEWWGRVECLFQLGIFWTNEHAVNNDEDHQSQWEDVCITPKYNRVVGKGLDLQKVLVEEVEATKEENYLEHSII